MSPVLTSQSHFWLHENCQYNLALSQDVIHVQSHAYTYISSSLAIYVIQVSHERLAKIHHVFFIANNWDPVVRWWSLLSSDKQAAFRHGKMFERRRHTTAEMLQRYLVLGHCCLHTGSGEPEREPLKFLSGFSVSRRYDTSCCTQKQRTFFCVALYVEKSGSPSSQHNK